MFGCVLSRSSRTGTRPLPAVAGGRGRLARGKTGGTSPAPAAQSTGLCVACGKNVSVARLLLLRHRKHAAQAQEAAKANGIHTALVAKHSHLRTSARTWSDQIRAWTMWPSPQCTGAHPQHMPHGRPHQTHRSCQRSQQPHRQP